MSDQKKLFMIKTPTWVDGVFDVTHYHAFHGTGYRGGNKFPINEKSYQPGIPRDVTVPLELQRAGVEIPTVFKPHPRINLVVNQTTKDALACFENIEFLKVKFKKLIRFSMKKRVYDFDHEKYDMDKYLDQMSNDISLFDDTGNYYEILCKKIQDEDNFGGRIIAVDDEFGNSISVSLDHLKYYPLFWNSELFAREDFYAAISPFMDKDFFEIQEIPI